MIPETIFGSFAIFLLQCHLIVCAPPISIQSSSGTVSPNLNQPGGLQYENGNGNENSSPSRNNLQQKYGGYDPNQQYNQMNSGYNMPYGLQRPPMYFPPPPFNPQPYQVPMNFYPNGGNGFYYGNEIRQPNGVIPGMNPYGNSPAVPSQYPAQAPVPPQQQQQHYQFGSHPSQLSHYQAQGGSPSLSPFSRSGKGDEHHDKKSVQ